MNEADIIASIRSTFAGVRAGAISLHEAQAIDSYADLVERAEARRFDVEEHWWRVPDLSISECPDALPHLDPEGWRYYLPAYMTWSLRHLHHSESRVVDSTIHSLALIGDEGLKDYQLARFGTLSAGQSQAACSFLGLMARNEEHADAGVAQEAIDQYWGRFHAEPDV